MRRGRRAFVGSGFGPNYYPYYDSADYYPDYDSQDQVGEAPPAPFRALTASPASPAKPPQSLVMELRGDHWVRLTSHGPMETSEESSATESGRAAASVRAQGAAATAPTQPPSELPPAVLVFLDGHQEEVAKYTIVGTTISIKTDYWSSGSWMRKIPIAHLNLAATLQANQQRGAKFSLPSRPSEVIVRRSFYGGKDLGSSLLGFRRPGHFQFHVHHVFYLQEKIAGIRDSPGYIGNFEFTGSRPMISR